MVNFNLQGNSSNKEKRSLATHCPIMVRAHTEGHHFNEEVCRCDVANIKKSMGSFRCKSTPPCMGRSLILSRGEKVTSNYELLSVL